MQPPTNVEQPPMNFVGPPMNVVQPPMNVVQLPMNVVQPPMTVVQQPVGETIEVIQQKANQLKIALIIFIVVSCLCNFYTFFGVLGFGGAYYYLGGSGITVFLIMLVVLAIIVREILAIVFAVGGFKNVQCGFAALVISGIYLALLGIGLFWAFGYYGGYTFSSVFFWYPCIQTAYFIILLNGYKYGNKIIEHEKAQGGAIYLTSPQVYV